MSKSSKHFKLLDRILRLLSKNTHHSLEFDKIVEKLNLSEVKGDFFGTPITLIPLGDTHTKHFNLVSALDFLVKEGYVYVLIDGYKISYKGLIKLKTDPFKDEINKKEWGSKRERMLLVITVLSLIFAFLKEFQKLFNC